MYLKKCFIKNMGPIKELDLNFPFQGDRPIPIVFVGKNGTGKSIVLSHIVDVLCEMGKSVYEDVIKPTEEFKKPFFRLV
jgi:signal recognition particle GTPase